MYNDIGGDCVVETQSELKRAEHNLEEELNRISCMLKDAHGIIDHLEKRISMVLLPIPAQDGGCGTTELGEKPEPIDMRSPMVQVLNGRTKQAAMIGNGVSRLVERIAMLSDRVEQ